MKKALLYFSFLLSILISSQSWSMSSSSSSASDSELSNQFLNFLDKNEYTFALNFFQANSEKILPTSLVYALTRLAYGDAIEKQPSNDFIELFTLILNNPKLSKEDVLNFKSIGKYSYGETILMKAAKNGQIELVKALLNAGAADVNAEDGLHKQALQHAYEKWNENNFPERLKNVMEVLIKNGSNKKLLEYFLTMYNQLPFSLDNQKRKQILGELIAIEPNTKPQTGSSSTAPHGFNQKLGIELGDLVYRQKYTEAIDLFKNHAAQIPPETYIAIIMTLLPIDKMEAPPEKLQLDLLELLIHDKNFPKEEVKSYKLKDWTILMLAAQVGFTELVEQLLQVGAADINAQDNNHRNALDLAAETSKYAFSPAKLKRLQDTMILLVQYGADTQWLKSGPFSKTERALLEKVLATKRLNDPEVLIDNLNKLATTTSGLANVL